MKRPVGRSGHGTKNWLSLTRCWEEIPEIVGPLDDPGSLRTGSLMDLLRLVHAWNYRRYILAVGFPTRELQSEIRYTTKKIEGNFSNFSAWHQRTKVLSCLWETLHRVEGLDAGVTIEKMQKAGKTDHLCLEWPVFQQSFSRI